MATHRAVLVAVNALVYFNPPIPGIDFGWAQDSCLNGPAIVVSCKACATYARQPTSLPDAAGRANLLRAVIGVGYQAVAAVWACPPRTGHPVTRTDVGGSMPSGSNCASASECQCNPASLLAALDGMLNTHPNPARRAGAVATAVRRSGCSSLGSGRLRCSISQRCISTST